LFVTVVLKYRALIFQSNKAGLHDFLHKSIYCVHVHIISDFVSLHLDSTGVLYLSRQIQWLMLIPSSYTTQLSCCCKCSEGYDPCAMQTTDFERNSWGPVIFFGDYNLNLLAWKNSLVFLLHCRCLLQQFFQWCLPT